MGVLLHYMLTQINVDGWNPESLIRAINARTDVDFNENLERQYQDLNAVDKYVVNHSKEFRRGIALCQIRNIESYKPDGIAKKLRATCDCVRMSTKKYLDTIVGDYEDISETKVRVYTLKPKEQIPDLYAIIEYQEHQAASLEAEEAEEEPAKMKVSSEDLD